METIYKSICLEDFKSRRPGFSMSIDGDFNDDEYNDYGKFPYDLLISEYDKLMDIKDGIPLVKNLNDEYVLRYKNMIKARSFLMDIINGKYYDSYNNEFVNNTTYYKLCIIDGDLTWIEMTDEMWENISGEKNISEYDKFFLKYDDGTNVVRGIFPIKPNQYFKFYERLNGNRIFSFNLNDNPYYYKYYYKTDDGIYRIGPLTSDEYPPKYCFSYTLNGETKYIINKRELKSKYYPLIVSHEMTIETVYYDTEKYYNIYKVGDIIGVNKNANEYNKRFCRDFEWAYGGSSTSKEEEVKKLPDTTFENFETTYIYEGKEDDIHKKDFYFTLIPAQNRVRYDEIFLTKASNLLDKKTYSSEDFSEPFFDISLYIEEEFDDSGLLSPMLEKWEANKKYKIGDIVIYNDETYRLKDINADKVLVGKTIENAISEYENAGYGYEVIPISKSLYDANIDNKYYSYRLKNDSDGGYYLYTFYYKGYFSEKDRITYFDTTDSFGNLLKINSNEYYHWIKTYAVETGETDTSKVIAVYESKIDELTRLRVSNDDDGNILPFCFHFNDDKEDSISRDTELIYMLGKSNIYNGECNFLYKINIYTEMSSGKEVLVGSFKYSHEYDSNGNPTSEDNYIKCSDIEEVINSWGTKDTGRTFAIEFKYIKSCQVDSNYEYGVSANIDEKTGEVIDSTYGILHRDKYPFTIDDYYCFVSGYKDTEYGWNEYTLATGETEDDDGNITIGETEYPDYESDEMLIPSEKLYGKTFRYIGFTNDYFTSGTTYRCECIFKYVSIAYDNTYIKGGDGAIANSFSEATINKSNFVNDDFQTVDFYKDDALLGIQNFDSNVDVYIDRGTSSASERIFALGEIKTFDDLIKYRGDMYDLESQKQK